MPRFDACFGGGYGVDDDGMKEKELQKNDDSGEEGHYAARQPFS